MSYSNYDVAHRFATGLGDHCTGSHMFFEGDTIYSYGYHFPMAIKWNGKLLFNDDRYSVTTAKHQGYVWSACSHYDIIHCATLGYTPGGRMFIEENLKIWKSEVDELTKKMALAVKPQIWMAKILNVVDKVERFCNEFDVAMSEDFYKFKVDEEIERVKELAKEERKKELAKEKEREERMAKEFMEFKTHWYWSKYQIVRYNAEKNRFETSKHVEIPYEVGRRFYEALKNGEVKPGDKVLYYRVNGVGDTIRIGCHTFKKKWLLEYGKKMFEN